MCCAGFAIVALQDTNAMSRSCPHALPQPTPVLEQEVLTADRCTNSPEPPDNLCDVANRALVHSPGRI